MRLAECAYNTPVSMMRESDLQDLYDKISVRISLMVTVTSSAITEI